MARDSIIVHDSNTTASHAGINWIELPEKISNLHVEVEQSGTASTCNVFGSHTNSGNKLGRARFPGQRLFTLLSASATYHVITANQYPRYLAVTTSATVDCLIKVTAHFEK